MFDNLQVCDVDIYNLLLFLLYLVVTSPWATLQRHQLMDYLLEM